MHCDEDILHVCRHARGREEWESAALQNGNTKCNGLLPLWGPQVAESAYASCLARWVSISLTLQCQLVHIAAVHTV